MSEFAGSVGQVEFIRHVATIAHDPGHIGVRQSSITPLTIKTVLIKLNLTKFSIFPSHQEDCKHTPELPVHSDLKENILPFVCFQKLFPFDLPTLVLIKDTVDSGDTRLNESNISEDDTTATTLLVFRFSNPSFLSSIKLVWHREGADLVQQSQSVRISSSVKNVRMNEPCEELLILYISSRWRRTMNSLQNDKTCQKYLKSFHVRDQKKSVRNNKMYLLPPLKDDANNHKS